MVNDKFSTDEFKAAYSILNYLVKCPSAKDTLQGIAEWWLLKEQIDQAVEKVSKALDFLVSKGFVIVKRCQYQERYYQINVEKIEEIRNIVSSYE